MADHARDAGPMGVLGILLGRPPSVALLSPSAPALSFNRPPFFRCSGRQEVAAALVARQSVPMTSLLLLKKPDLAAYLLIMGGCDASKLEEALKQGTAGVVETACGR